MAILYYIIPSIIAIAALSVIGVIYVKKFPKVSALDLEAMTAHRQQQRKTSLVEERLRRKLSAWRLSLEAFFKPILKVLGKLLRGIFHNLVQLEQRYKQVAKGTIAESDVTGAPSTVATSIQEGQTLLADEKLVEAEKKFIAAIGVDPRAIGAYHGLAKVYEEMNNYKDAVATLQFLVQLDPKDESIYLKLGELLTKANRLEDAMDAFEQALELGPNNPKNLDAFIEIAILNGLKYKAQSTLDKLKAVNPENQKLAKYQEEINAL